MAGLQRSSVTFRRSGSSGLVWDERFMSGDSDPRDRSSGDQEGKPMEFKELRHSRSVGSIGLQRRRNDGMAHSQCISSHGFHARSVTPAADPPSPKVNGCIFCGIFRKAGGSEPSKPRRY